MMVAVFDSLAVGAVRFPGVATLLQMGGLFLGLLGVFALLRWRAAILVVLIILSAGVGVSFHEFFVDDYLRVRILQDVGVGYFFLEFLAWLGPLMLGTVWYLRLETLPERKWLLEM
ncbi:MAG: hypothetical protein GY869_20285 [Planctomycetes bacterium]|nr:hypothetical protein [Planctomycetota bacterium]